MTDTIQFIGHIINSGKKRIINVPANQFDNIDKLLEKLEIKEMNSLYFKIYLEPIILEKRE